MIAYIITALLIVVSVIYIIIQSVSQKKSTKIALDSENWIPFELKEIEVISHDVKKFRFALQSSQHVLGLPIGQHISLKYTDSEGKEVQRSYTPVSSNDDIGFVDFVVKIYFKNVHPKFPNGGMMSQYLNDMKIGEKILMKGPKGHLEYLERGAFTIKKRQDVIKYHKKKLGLVCGGTGITPMLQVIRAILKDPKDQTEVWLLFANQTEEDILLRQELESLPSDRFHLWYTLDRPGADWKYSSGFINKDMCQAHLPPPSDESMLFVCGPPPMIKYACEPAFKELGFDESQWFSF